MGTDTLTKPDTVTFLSKGKNYRVLRQRVKELRNDVGALVSVPGTGVAYQFEPADGTGGFLKVRPGQDVLPVSEAQPDKSEDVVEFLRRHPDNGTMFREVDPIPPDAGEVLAEITVLGVQQDTVRLAEILDVEERNWRRPQVLEAAELALNTIEGRSPGEAAEGVPEQTVSG